MNNHQEPTATAVKPELKVPCEVYSRIVGYLRPTRNWNEGKQEEFKERQIFQLEIGSPK
ncbi:MAG: anaerobic ribonucleoside-triphosphate reductase [Chloroflexota bacterium]|nr:anaerobic ribonucleoside-triphosphate reductase [Chloroflexota bacterium]